ncbi:prepilin peptidase [Gymnodinialimonas sp. 2305UL16-5]|uniref:prepilin peptidase n=1 Tax=Gymnodinialimonas mytili TaxID=3126503 RepID=UPI003098F35E
MPFDVSLTAAQAWVFLPFVVPMALWAIYTDLKDLKILNVCVLTLFAGFVVLGPFALPLEEYAWRFTHMGVVLVIGFLLSAVGVFGAGDAKFAAAAAPFVAAQDAMIVLFIVANSALVFMILHRIARRVPALVNATPDWASWNTGRKSALKQVFPYGLGLSTGMIIYMILGVTNSAGA